MWWVVLLAGIVVVAALLPTHDWAEETYQGIWYIYKCEKCSERCYKKDPQAGELMAPTPDCQEWVETDILCQPNQEE